MDDLIQYQIMGKEYEVDPDELLKNPSKTLDAIKYRQQLINAQYQLGMLQREMKIEYSKFAALQLKRDPKLAEWKIKIKWNTSKAGEMYSKAIIVAEKTVGLIEGILKILFIE